MSVELDLKMELGSGVQMEKYWSKKESRDGCFWIVPI
jgi:hypothetical protein